MANLECIIHYELKDKTYSDIKEVSDVNWEKIKQAKEIRISKGGVNHHKQQCDLVPDVLDPELHGIHNRPCYGNFTMIISKEKKK